MKRYSKDLLGATTETFVKESDSGCVILLTAVMEKNLELLHQTMIGALTLGKSLLVKQYNGIFESLMKPFAPLSTLDGKIRIACAYGLIDYEDYQCFEAMRKLRNEAAHAEFVFKLDDVGLKPLLDTLAAQKMTQLALKESATHPDWVNVPEAKKKFIFGCLALKENILRTIKAGGDIMEQRLAEMHKELEKSDL